MLNVGSLCVCVRECVYVCVFDMCVQITKGCIITSVYQQFRLELHMHPMHSRTHRILFQLFINLTFRKVRFTFQPYQLPLKGVTKRVSAPFGVRTT